MAQREQHLDWDQRAHESVLVVIMPFIALSHSAVPAENLIPWLLCLPGLLFSRLGRWCKLIRCGSR